MKSKHVRDTGVGFALSAVFATVPAQGGLLSDSSAVLFADTTVHKYTLTFYDAKWDSVMQANWAYEQATDSSIFIPARFSDGTTTLDSVGVRYKGNSSYTLAGASLKKPYKIKFNKFRKKQTYYGVKVLNFSNGIGDPTLLREKISYDVARKYMAAPRAGFSTIWVDTGAPIQIGLYTQVEEADESFLARWFSDDSENLFKAGNDGSPLVYRGDTARSYSDSGLYELKTNTSANNWNGFIRFVKFLDTNRVDSATFDANRASYFDIDNVTRYLAFNMVFSNFDSYTGSGRNYYLYESGTGAMTIIPWDLNLSFGAYFNGWGYAQMVKNDLIGVANLAQRPLNYRVIKNDSLRYRYLYWVRRLIQEAAATDSIRAAIDRLAPVLRPYVGADANAFYDSAAFETNLTSNYKESPSSTIPGLIAFSSARNDTLLSMVSRYLPSDYGATSVKAAGLPSTLRLGRSGRNWALSGVQDLGDFRVDWYQAGGRKTGGRAATGSEGSLTLNLPRGLVYVRVSSDRGSQSFLVDNL